MVVRSKIRPASGRKRILIVDDHPVVREGLSLLIQGEPDLEVCGEAGNLLDAYQAASELKPDMLIVDLELDGADGIELIKRLTGELGSWRILVLSIHDENLYAERALRAGAIGYIMKKAEGQELLRAIRQVLKDRIYLGRDIEDRVLHQLVQSRHSLNESPLSYLSDRELEVLRQIGRGLKTRVIASNLHLSPKTIDTYRERMKKKLNVSDSNELAQYAYSMLWGKSEGSPLSDAPPLEH